MNRRIGNFVKTFREEKKMSESNSSGVTPHFMQKALDNQWLMLALGVLVPMVIYTFWGLWDVMHIVQAP